MNRGLPREHLISILAARDGACGSRTLQSVMVLRKGAGTSSAPAWSPTGTPRSAEDSAGRIWLSDISGSRPITGVDARARPLAYPTPGSQRAARTMFDRDGNLWGMNGVTGIFRVRDPQADRRGLARAAAARVETFQAKDGLATNNTTSIIEDREGDIWVGSTSAWTGSGPAKVVVEPKLTQIATWGYALLGASDGAVYVGQASSVYRILPGGEPEPILENARETEAICEGGDGDVWIVLQDRIVNFRRGRISRIDRPPTTDPYDPGLRRRRAKVLWLAAGRDGLLRRTGGGWQALMVPTREGEEKVADPNTIRLRDGRLLAYFGPSSPRWIDAAGHTDVVFSPGRLGEGGHLLAGAERPAARRRLRPGAAAAAAASRSSPPSASRRSAARPASSVALPVKPG